MDRAEAHPQSDVSWKGRSCGSVPSLAIPASSIAGAVSIMPSLTVDPPVLCRVVESRSAETTRLALRVEAPRGSAGWYSLVVRKSDPAGTATMQQGGGFDLAPGETRDVGNLTVSVLPNGQLRIDASVLIDGRKINCGHISIYDL